MRKGWEWLSLKCRGHAVGMAHAGSLATLEKARGLRDDVVTQISNHENQKKSLMGWAELAAPGKVVKPRACIRVLRVF